MCYEKNLASLTDDVTDPTDGSVESHRGAKLQKEKRRHVVGDEKRGGEPREEVVVALLYRRLCRGKQTPSKKKQK